LDVGIELKGLTALPFPHQLILLNGVDCHTELRIIA
jgi:hypothetical protein